MWSSSLLCPSPCQVTASCPAVCDCPGEPLICPPGVSTVPDGCGCCKVCAAQLNQDCSPMRPCDHHKGLECNYGNDVTMAWGICRGEREFMLGGKEFHSENNCLLQLFALLTWWRTQYYHAWKRVIYLRWIWWVWYSIKAKRWCNVQKMSRKWNLLDSPFHTVKAVTT